MVSWGCWCLFQICPFCLKIGTCGISRMLILILTLVFWILNPKSIAGQIWIEKVKVVRLAWKLAHMVSLGCWCLFQHYFSEFPILNLFLSKFGPKKSKFSVLSENWNAWYFEDTDSYSKINFLNFKT